MMNVIEGLYCGDLEPSHDMSDRGKKNIKEVIRHEEIMEQYLDEKGKKLFYEFIKAQEEMFDGDCRETFVEGWRMGARFVADTFKVI